MIIPTRGEWCLCMICFCIHKRKHTKRHFNKCSIRINPEYKQCLYCRKYIHMNDIDYHHYIC